ncbi:hypothetical protein [Falsiphaeobacter marinintestinus]|uniref:hypothetical protein n=1 Tax=Falsiphaeobacter marinintestinus TaxID=1492905 RepID=UPI0011B3DA6D|nr:hypothetical protein [Phaeobacter marinintestinus]
MKKLMLIAVLGTVATGAFASDLAKWGETGKWIIRVDPEAGNGCFMESQLEDGTLIQFGNVPNREGGFFAVYNPDWTDIKDGEISTVKFDFEKLRFSGEALGVVRGDLFGGYAFFDNPNVPMEFAKNRSMTVIGGKGRVVEVDLSGTSKAISAVQKCQDEQTK